MPSKADIRNKMKSQPRSSEAHGKVCDFLVQTLKSFQFVGSYQALKSEIDLTELQSRLPHLKLAYPKLVGEELYFYGSNSFEVGTHNILEPLSEDQILLSQLEAVLIPGRAFDREGHRLGRGKGHFDRTLKNYSGLKVGILESNQLFEALPFEGHDVLMDLLVTEKFVLRPLVKRKENYV